MDGSDHEKETAPIVVIMDRRKERQAELSCTEIMKILRKRAAKAAQRKSIDGQSNTEKTAGTFLS